MSKVSDLLRRILSSRYHLVITARVTCDLYRQHVHNVRESLTVPVCEFYL